MRVVFMGTPDIAATCLTCLCGTELQPVAVYTKPDMPKNRGMKMAMSEVKEVALAHEIPVYQPETMKNGAFADTLSAIDPEVIVVAAYGKILPSYILDYPKYGCINAHGSLLPKYRGAAPIQRAIMDGETVTGITSMYMAAGLDTGDMILKIQVPITEEDDFGTLHDKLAAAGGTAMLQTIAALKFLL